MRKFDLAGPFPAEVPLGPDELPIDDLKNLPTQGCNVELTEILAPNDESWYSFGLESFGDLMTIAGNLRMVADELTKRGAVPSLQGGERMSYPRWITRYVAPSCPT